MIAQFDPATNKSADSDTAPVLIRTSVGGVETVVAACFLSNLSRRFTAVVRNIVHISDSRMSVIYDKVSQ